MAILPNIDQSLFDKVDAVYRPTLRHLSQPNPKILIMFSGPPSSGKSRIARAAEERFKAVRLENDAIRTIAAEWFPASGPQWRSRLAYGYMSYLSSELIKHAVNGTWVLDFSIDSEYRRLFAFADKYGFDTIVLAMDIPEDIHKQWIMTRGDRSFGTATEYLKLMHKRRQAQKLFLGSNKPDIVVPYDYVMEDLLKKS